MAVETGTPATVWSGKGGEFATSGPFLLVDASGLLLADASGDELTDSGIVFVPTPATVWTRNDAL
jgi:hypothetical protein